MIWILRIFSFYVVFVPSTTTTMSPALTTATSASKEPQLSSLNGSSVIKINRVLQLNSSFSLGVRMCKGNSDLVTQSGASGDSFKLRSVDRNVVLSYSLRSNRSGAVELTLATNLELETWFEIHWNVSEERRIGFYVDGKGSDFIVTLNSTLEDDMRSIDLSNGTELIIGGNFTGCLKSGEQIDLSPFSTGNCFLDGGQCPEEAVKSCADVTCQNNGSCEESTSPRCVCPSGFKGSFCEEVGSPGGCSKSSCLNGGTCVKKDGNFSCSCVQEVIDHGNFTTGNNSYKVGYEGEFCEKWIDACNLMPSICIEGACKKDAQRPLGFTCFCPQGEDFRVGEYCQYKTDICRVGSKCLNGGTCVALGGERFRCTCAPGFTGKNCQVNINECASNPCMNNGTCVDGINSFTCSCLNGTVGLSCETNINECASAPCINGGQCIDLINGFTCNCSNTGYEGVLCQTEADECVSSPCQNGGTCQDLFNGYNCTCYPGYTGHSCEVDIDECLSDPCLNEGLCYQNNLLNPNPANNSGHHCICAGGYLGVNCEVDVDECLSSPCEYGDCENLANAYSCKCHPGFEDERCSTKINLCARQPCDQGICVDFFPHYKCVCTNESMFGGNNCSVLLTGCDGVSCSEGSICTPLFIEPQSLHSHQCECPHGFTGPNCQIDTSLSFNKNSSLILKIDGLHSLSFKFKTIKAQQHLLTVATTSFLLVLESNHQCIRVHHSEDPAARPSTWDMCPAIAFNFSNWNQIDIQINDSLIIVYLHHKGCLDKLCTVSLNNTSPSNESTYLHYGRVYKELYFNESLSPVLVDVMSRDFVGCLSDLKLNDEHLEINLTSDVILFSRLEKGCNRGLQCNNACENGGSCVDLWSDFRCVCARTFYGKTCSQVMESATFGHNLKSSFMNFPFPESSQSIDLKWSLEVSTMIRTRDNNGFLFFIQFDEGNSSSVGHMSCEIIDGFIFITASFSENMDEQGVMKVNFTKYLDGQKYFMKISSNDTTLSLRMNNDEHLKHFNFTKVFPVKATQVYIGGINKGEKTKRASPYGFQSAKNFVGWLQDFRINDVVFDLICGGSSMNMSGKVVASDCQDVLPGEVTSDICSLRSPCSNGSTCANVFYNDYKCICPKNFFGVECKEITFCSLYSCPRGSICVDIESGFECVKNVRIKKSVRFLLDLRGEDLKNASLRFKTNSKIVRLLQMDAIKVKSCIASVDLIDDKLKLKFNDLTVQSLQINQTNRWHDINIQISPFSLTFLSNQSTASMWIDGSCFSSTALLEVRISDDVSDFDGCFSATRINNILLPFFSFDDLHKVTSFRDRFIEISVDNIGACQSDDACQPNPCKSGGVCQEDYNSFICLCPPGYDGNTCDICLSSDCTQNCSSDANCNNSCNGYCEASPVLSRGQLIGIIVGTVVGALLLVLISIIVYSIVKIKAKRAKQGVYNPSMEEATGASVQFNDALKIPQEERLI